MYTTRFQALMTEGYALSNKIHFNEFDPHEFGQWLSACRSLLSLCEPEPYFPWNPDPRHIEELVMLLSATQRKISKGEVQYTGLL